MSDNLYRRQATDPINDTYFNLLLADIRARLERLEKFEPDWEEQVAALVNIGVQRIDTFLTPAVEQVQELSGLGFLVADSSTSTTFVVGQEVTLVVDEGTKRDLFAPSPNVSITSASVQGLVVLAERVGEYNAETGELVVNPWYISGPNGALDDWVITSEPGIAKAVFEIYALVVAAEALAVASASAAGDSASAAATSEGAAAASATAAQGHAGGASTFRGQASSFADTAQTHANTASGHADAAAASAATAGSAAAAAVADRPTFEETYFLAVTL
ncbi:MAG: hypothetical protein ROR55_20010 [Devosia sp.]